MATNEFRSSNGFTVRTVDYQHIYIDNVYLNRPHLEALLEYAEYLRENPIR